MRTIGLYGFCVIVLLKILYNKYVPMMTIRFGHVDNHFSDKFIPLCHVDYFINADRQKLMVVYICHTFLHFHGLNFVFFIFQGRICQQITHPGIKWLFTLKSKILYNTQRVNLQ